MTRDLSTVRMPVTLLLMAVLLSGCSMGQIVVRSSMSIMDGNLDAMNRETDLALAAAAIPANLKLLEGMIAEDPHNVTLRIYAAQGFYGYAYGFVEDEDRARASALYRRGFMHARHALGRAGLDADPLRARQRELESAVEALGAKAVPALFWSASCLAKLVDLNRDDPTLLPGLGNSATLMRRVLALDERYYYGGAHLFFGVYYGGVAPMFGGDFERAERHFEQARRITDGKLLVADVLYAQYFARQRLDRAAFHDRLTAVVNAPSDLLPEMALANTIAQRKARVLLELEQEWF